MMTKISNYLAVILIGTFYIFKNNGKNISRGKMTNSVQELGALKQTVGRMEQQLQRMDQRLQRIESSTINPPPMPPPPPPPSRTNFKQQYDQDMIRGILSIFYITQYFNLICL